MNHSEILLSSIALKHNFDQLKILCGGKALFPVVKANAYGHGLIEIARHLEEFYDETLLPYFCVARFQEAKKLRLSGCGRSILVLSEYTQEDLESSQNLGDIDFVVSRFEDFEILSKIKLQREKASVGIHLNINTGMNRLGFDFRRLEQHVDLITLKLLSLQAEGWHWNGIMTHLARGEEDPVLYSQVQVERFHQATVFLKSKLLPRGLKWPRWVHVSNSGGILRGVAKDPSINACRPGIHLWGAYGDRKDCGHFDLKPVLNCSAEIRQVQHLKKGDTVGYGQKFRCEKDRIIGTVNLGYADGLPRILSRQQADSWKLGMVVEGVRVPFVGIISMDMCMIDLTEHPLFLNKGFGSIEPMRAFWISPQQSSEEIAEALGTIPYEILCNLSARLRREIVYGK